MGQKKIKNRGNNRDQARADLAALKRTDPDTYRVVCKARADRRSNKQSLASVIHDVTSRGTDGDDNAGPSRGKHTDGGSVLWR